MKKKLLKFREINKNITSDTNLEINIDSITKNLGEISSGNIDLMNNKKADYTNTFAALTLNTVSNDSLFTSNEFKEWIEAVGSYENNYDVLYLNKITND